MIWDSRIMRELGAKGNVESGFEVSEKQATQAAEAYSDWMDAYMEYLDAVNAASGISMVGACRRQESGNWWC